MVAKSLKPHFHRWSLQTLSELTQVSSTASAHLLDCILQRLEYQEQVVHDLLQWSPLRQKNRLAVKGLETLAYIHKDTCRVGRELSTHPTLWERFTTADRHVVHSTFLEIRARHANTVEACVEILGHVREEWQREQQEDDNMDALEHYILLHESIENLLRRRLGIQLLCDHHVELHERSRSCVTTNAPLQSFVEQAVTESQHIVEAHLQLHPDVTMYGQASGVAVIRPWFHHTLVELLKNAMAAVIAVQEHSTSSAIILPPIAIHIDQDDTGVSIGIIDRGTGIDTEDHHILGLGHSRTARRWDRLDEQQSYAAVRSPLSSLGVGLKVARYQVEHFGGRLDVANNTNGGGCTASIFLPTDDTILENIPLHNWLSDQDEEQ